MKEDPGFDHLSVILAALADPTRRAIIDRLASGSATVSDLAALFPTLSRPAISRHLRVLRLAGFIEQGRDSRWRPCTLQPRPLADLDAFIEPYRRRFAERYDRLEELLHQLQAQESPSS